MTTNDDGSRKLLLIGWDGADWAHINPLLERGLLPNLERFIAEGTSGNLATLGPMLSPMLWNSVATGKYAYKHGIHGFTEPDRFNGGARPFSSYSRRTKAIWNMLSQQGLRSNVINWWASHPAEEINGCVISNLYAGIKPGADGPIVPAGAIHPVDREAFLGRYKVFPQELTGEQICAFIPHADRINQDEDARLQGFAQVFTETLTTHAVATAVMETEPWDFMAIYYTCHDHFAHAFMDYHPPRLPWIPEQDFEIFKDVVTNAYRFSDMMLGRLLQFCHDDTTVIICSDHGFESGSLRLQGSPREPAGPAAAHRKFGIFLAKGPNIRVGEKVYGASLIDLAPTMLAALDQPIGLDMDGRALLEIFRDAPSLKLIPSWDDVAGPHADGMHGEEQPLDPDEAADLLRQFVALGYIDDPGSDKEKQFDSAEIECDYNLAQNYLFASKPQAAVPLLEGLVQRSPWEDRFITQLAHAYHKAGRLQSALDLIEKAYDIEHTRSIGMKVLYAEIKLGLGHDFAALEPILERAAELNRSGPQLMNRIAAIYASQRRWDDAERLYRRTLELDPDDARAYQGLSRVYCRQGRNQETIDAALAAVSLVHRLPHAHLNLGVALARSGHPEMAAVAFQTALQFSPGFLHAHRCLLRLYRGPLGDDGAAAHQATLMEQYAQRHKVDRADRRRLRTAPTPFTLPDFPSEHQRQEILIEQRPDRVDERRPSGKELLLVSGLPRSGTSLMMQMLEAGGIAPQTDRERDADDDNPKGYYEWEAIKQLATDRRLLDADELADKAIKVVSALLKKLPYQHRYKVIFMTRPIEEVARSQATMIDRRGTQGAPGDEAELARSLATHRADVIAWLDAHPRIEFIQVDYPSLVEDPGTAVPEIVRFLGDRTVDPDAMTAVIDRSLYRNRRFKAAG